MTVRKRLLVVSYSLTQGGAERFTSNLLLDLDPARFEPQVCLLRNEITYPLPAAVPVHVLDKTRPWHMVRTVLRLRRLIEDQHPDVVLSTIAYASRITGTALSLARHRPAWLARIGNDPNREHQLWKRMTDSWVLPRVQRIAANSVGLANAFARRWPASNGRVIALPNPTRFDEIDRLCEQRVGLPTDLSADSQRTPSILAVGRLSVQKRPDLLLDAFVELRRLGTQAHLFFLGSGPLDHPMRARMRDQGLGQWVHFLGFQQNPYVYLARASLFALTSDHEGSPNALIEAQGLGVPAVSTRCPYGPDEIILEGETGHLVPPGGARAFARAMHAILADPAKRDAMGRAARARARSLFDRTVAIPQWEAALLDPGACAEPVTINSRRGGEQVT